MKIGVLTHPFFGNYGGMLQAYAMVTVLRSMGHDAFNLVFLPPRPPSFLKHPIRNLRMKLNIGTRLRCLLLMLRPEKGTAAPKGGAALRNGQRFQRQYMPCIWIGDNPAVQLAESGIEVIVVGSDQVWRGGYARSQKSLPFFFLDFATEAVRHRSIAYAASFGTDTWEGYEQETEVCRKLLQEFKAVSVRESSGVDVCRTVFERAVLHVVDPTLLLQNSDYQALIDAEKSMVPASSFISTYLLDAHSETSSAISAIARSLNLPIRPLKDNPQAPHRRDRLPFSVGQWLRHIRDAEYFITDSFHGCVFAIIFNKPFVCLGNERRGSARFDSLLSTFSLQERLITTRDADTIVQTLTTPIDWDRVNAIRRSEQQRAYGFLLSNLGKV